MSDKSKQTDLHLFSKLDANTTKEITQDYFKHITGLISLVLRQIKSHADADESDIVEIERLLRLVNACPQEELFLETFNKIWESRQHILNKDLDHFMEHDYNEEIKGAKELKETQWITNMIDIARYYIKGLTEKEIKSYWKKCAEILKVIVTYKKAVGAI